MSARIFDAILEGVDVHYSPSQLSKYMSCRRKWWFEYVGKFKPPGTKSQALGKAIHAEIEASLQKGRLTLDTRAAAAIAELAKVEASGDGSLEARLQAMALDPQTYSEVVALDVESGAIQVERPIEILLPPTRAFRVRKYIGAIDLYDARDHTLPKVTDHKTTSDLKYAKTTHELAEDVQMLSYAHWALVQPEHRTADRAIVRHLALPTRGRVTAICTEAEVRRPHVEARWASYLPILDQMDEAHQVTEAAAVPADGYQNNECDRFGGCPHRERCAGAIFRRGEMSMSNIQDRLRALREGQGGASPVPPAQAPTPAAPPPVQPAPAPVAAAPQAEAPKPFPAAPAQANESAMDRLKRLKANMAASGAGTQPPAPDAAPPPEVHAAPIDIRTRLDQVRNEGAARQEAAAPAAPPVQPPAVPEAPPPVVQAPAPQHAHVPPVTQQTPNAGGRISILFLDSQPVSGLGAVRLEEWIAPLLEYIRTTTGLSWQLHEYRKGPGLICDGLATSELPEYLVVDTTTSLGKVALEALIPRADIVVAGKAA